MNSRTISFALLAIFITLFTPVSFAKKPLTFEALMKFKQIESVTLSEDGNHVAYSLKPDRGDPMGVLVSKRGKALANVPNGTAPLFSVNGRWVAFKIEPAFTDKLAADNAEKKAALKKGLAVYDTQGKEVLIAERVKSFAFSGDGQWLAYHLEAPEKGKEEREEKDAEQTSVGSQASNSESNTATSEKSEETTNQEAEEKDEKVKKSKKAVKPGTTLVVRRMLDGVERRFESVHQYAFDNRGDRLAIATSIEDLPENNQLLLMHLHQENVEDIDLFSANDAIAGDNYATALQWTHKHSPDEVNTLAFISTALNDKHEPTDGNVFAWDENNQLQSLAVATQAPDGFQLPVADNPLQWAKSGKQLFFGFAIMDPKKADEKDKVASAKDENADETIDPFDLQTILEDKTLVRWHWDDDRIATQRESQKKEEEKRRYRAVVNINDTPKMTVLADKSMRTVSISDSELAALGFANKPYLKRMTWDWFIDDLYHVDLVSGERTKVAEALYHANSAALSPNGQFVAWYEDTHWYLWDANTGEKRNLSQGLKVSFADEDHDYPLPVGGYGKAQWLADSNAVLIADKFDIWRFDIDGGEPVRLTVNGREEQLQYRLVDTDPHQYAVSNGNVFVNGYSTRDKHDGFFAINTENAAVTKLELTGKHRFSFVAKAEQTDTVIFTRENYNEFPDLWRAELKLSDINLKKAKLRSKRKLTDANPQIEDFAWGNAELVRYRDADGELTDGVLIKPGNYEKGKKYPVVVYYYRFFSQRLHLFNKPVINHRPSFPLYASNGYAIFLPDVRFEIGRPGFSATKSLVPGVKKLIDMGIADPDAIGLHGHSWSGYTSAFVVTQTDIFSALVTGAPVANMTSAYSGIRYGSGLARQFQYEQSQSRIGGSLWEYPERYIENSPVFYADRINTPMLIQFGDEDEAVPWTQGIELYLAMRRLEKPAVFLQYEGEPHHLKQYANKLDYSIKMKEFFDHFLKGESAPKWWSEATKD